MMELSYRRHRFPPVVIRHAVWLYLRFTLSYRDVEDLLAERGFDVSYETVRSWVLKFAARKAARSRAVDRYRRTQGRARLAVRRASLGGADLQRIAGPRRRSPRPHLLMTAALAERCGGARALAGAARGGDADLEPTERRWVALAGKETRPIDLSGILTCLAKYSRSEITKTRRRSAPNLAPPATGKQSSDICRWLTAPTSQSY
jgi:hypothetical protein